MKCTIRNVVCVAFSAWAVGAGAETLTWNGRDGDVWRGPVVGGYWECVGRVPIRIGAREIELVLPRARFGTKPLDFQFHWKDNPESLTRLPTLQGDDAPERRFNYVFRR